MNVHLLHTKIFNYTMNGCNPTLIILKELTVVESSYGRLCLVDKDRNLIVWALYGSM